MESYQLNDDVNSEFKYFPILNIDCENGKVELVGRCFPEDEVGVYNQLKKYSENCIATGKYHLSFKLEYFNTSAAKIFFNWLRHLHTLYQEGLDVKIFWYCDKDDPYMEDAGLEYKEMIELPFEFVYYT